MRVRPEIAALWFAAGLILAACNGYGGGGATSSPLPSGSLGPVRPGEAAAAVEGLCGVAGSTDLQAASSAFYDRTHGELHVVAAAAEERDRAAAGRLLETIQVVEADLAGAALPVDFAKDVNALLGATRDALTELGLSAPACG